MSRKQSEVVEFTGRAPEMRESPWMAAEDIADLGDVVATIDHVYAHSNVEFEAGRSKALVYSVAFKGAKRQLILNSINRRTLQAMLGSDVKKWHGRKIALYVTTTKLMGKQVPCIRIRPEAADAK